MSAKSRTLKPQDRHVTVMELYMAFLKLHNRIKVLEDQARPFWIRWYVTLRNLNRKRADGRTGSS